MSHSPLTDLPSPFGLKKDLGQSQRCRIDIAAVKQADDKFCVVKIMNFKDKIKTAEALSVCYGKAYVFDWVGEVRSTKKVIHYIFNKMGGFQCRNHVLRTHEEGRPEKERSPDEWDFGFDYIEEKGPRDNTKNKQLRWVTTEINRPDSPIYKWPPAVVEKSLRNLSPMMVSLL